MPRVKTLRARRKSRNPNFLYGLLYNLRTPGVGNNCKGGSAKSDRFRRIASPLSSLSATFTEMLGGTAVAVTRTLGALSIGRELSA